MICCFVISLSFQKIGGFALFIIESIFLTFWNSLDNFKFLFNLFKKVLAIIILLFVVDQTIKKMKTTSDEQKSDFEYTNELIQKYQIGTAFAGISSGLLGIGGGAILVTTNRNILKMDARQSSGTSYLVAATIVPFSLLSHLLLDGVVTEMIDTIGWFAIIFIPIFVSLAAFFGAKFAIDNIPRDVVTKVFLGAVSLGIIRYFYDLISRI